MKRSFHCYAYGRPGDFEAICVDLDIAVQGKSMADVRRLLDEAITSYVEDATAESPDQARQLLSRRSPWHVRAKLALMLFFFKLRSHFDGHDGRATTDFNVPCPA